MPGGELRLVLEDSFAVQVHGARDTCSCFGNDRQASWISVGGGRAGMRDMRMTSRGERPTANGTGVVTAFPWELAVGAFAAASVLLAIVLDRAGSTVPALMFSVLGVVLTCFAAVAAWRKANANPRRRVPGRRGRPGSMGQVSALDPLELDEALAGGPVRSGLATRTGEDGADIDVGKIRDFRAHRDPVAVAPLDPVGGSQTGKGSEAVPLHADNGDWSFEGAPSLPPQLEALARDFQAVAGAMAAAVLVRRGRRLVPLVSSGNWSAAREVRAGSAPGTFESRGAPSETAPPEFPVDDQLADILASLTKALPFERWQEIEDVPPGLLPLVGLADQGASLGVACTFRRGFLALWVASGRDGLRRYSDRDLVALEVFVRERLSVVGAELAEVAGPPRRG